MIRRSSFALAAVTAAGVAVAIPLIAQERLPQADVSKAVPEADLWRPTAAPDRIILTWRGDPRSTQAVTWRTDTSVRQAVGQIAPADPGPGFVKQAQTVQARTTPLKTDLGESRYHTASFEGLKPETKYVYRVGDGTNWSEWAYFRTASDEAKPFSFIYFGDAQNDLKSMWSRVVRGAYADAPKAAFMIHAGDLINRANRDNDWAEWHYSAGWINTTLPSIPTPGNHEYASATTAGQPASGALAALATRRQLSGHWRPQFALPEDGPRGLEETVYSVDYQGLRIISLNSNERQADQVEWLEERLRNNPNRWTVVTFHHPIYSSAKGRDNAEIRRRWHPLLEKYRVDLVLQGHDHTYARSNLNTGMSVNEARSGTVYVVSVSGPKMYNLEREPWMERAAEDTQLYQLISIDGGRLRYQALTADGALYDAFELRKRDGEPNELKNRVPKRVPERLRPPVAAGSGR